MNHMGCFRFLVRGKVQGVGYRRFVKGCADMLGLSGWCMNLDDGRVEVHAEGILEDMEKLRGWLEEGPQGSLVESVESYPRRCQGLTGFRIRI